MSPRSPTAQDYIEFIDHRKVMPINEEILKTVSDASKQGVKAPEPGLVDKLFSEWKKYNSIRMLIVAVAWSLGTAALLLA